MQFVVGFPITGELQQKAVFHLKKEEDYVMLSPDSLYESKTARFRSRVPRANSRSPHELWEEAMKQVDKKWLGPPEPLDENGNFTESPSGRINIAFRFGVSQTDKLRGCDDFKDALTNRRCRVDTPITLPGWDHIASAARILSDRDNARAFGKIDHEAAYKALPLRPSDTRHAVIALWGPKSKKMFGFRPRTLLFGSTAAVIHYNCLSRIIASLACRILLLPTIGYFGDFGFFVNAQDAPMAMGNFTELFEILGLTLKKA